ncbi:hypothetical protein N7463_007071 [Penicillium fimorum]|uniref:Uncharacterized protein n=1 Tax=Penicillium fimorum TaxID=1882269 RepID=A0A9W9XVL4_9EURO|nr:hypothetical protein N7463_007071 [Penicillium fimorum]
MENHPLSPQACGSANPPTESSFSFTPIKALSALPRLWDRKPSTPVRAGDKTRKLWKRIRFPFAGMTAATEGQTSGIGPSKNSDYQRGVKRQCVDPADADQETEAEQRGRSFLETKWEMQASRKRRKLPEFNFNIHEDGSHEVFGFTANQPEGVPKDVVGDVATNAPTRPLSDLRESCKTPVYNDNMTIDPASDAKTAQDLQSGPSSQDMSTVIDNPGEGKTTAVSTECVQDLTQEQEIKLVRSALRSSLDGEDAELLNDFLFRANAKRAAKATHPEDSKSTEESPEVECSTTPSRRVLVELTTNSPSPVKLQISPSKYDAKRGADDQEDIILKELKEEQAPASPACRRSTRAKGSSTPSMRNTISLRRAKGTEFVFLQRTETQQVAMATKRNTRFNKGKSVTPMVALEALAQQSSEEELQTSNSQNEGSNRKDTNFRGLTKPRKQVSWNEERMAEYEEYREPIHDQEDEEEDDRCTNDVGATPRPRPESKRSAKKAESGHRSSRSQTQKADVTAGSGATQSGSTVPTTAPATVTPRSRRVRRLGDSGILGSGTPVKTGSRSTSKPPAASAASADAMVAAPSTPTKGRRKLAPKSPISSKLPARASKGVNNTADQPFVSGIPTRSSKSTDDGERQSMLQMSAGCTPTARRVRSRS